jgi:hypothetical protein
VEMHEHPKQNRLLRPNSFLSTCEHVGDLVFVVAHSKLVQPVAKTLQPFRLRRMPFQDLRRDTNGTRRRWNSVCQ